MSNKDNIEKNLSEAETLENEPIINPDTVPEAQEEVVTEVIEDEAILRDKLAEVQAELDKEKKEYLFLMAEFDNFRKRTLREKSEIIKSASEQSLKGMLPIIDDFERGLQASKDATDVQSVREGMELIYHKFIKYLEQNGVKAIDTEDRDFDTEKHEAVSAIPVQDEAQKGKILDTVQKGYTINGKIMRHAKVVVGQ